jgi:hypothetical protein
MLWIIKGRIWRRPLPDSIRLIRSHVQLTEKEEERKLDRWRNDGSLLLFIQVSRNVNRAYRITLRLLRDTFEPLDQKLFSVALNRKLR